MKSFWTIVHRAYATASTRTASNRILSSPVHGRTTPPIVSANDAVSSIQSNSDIYIHSHASTPTELLEALCQHVESKNLTDIRPSHIILQGNIPWLQEKFYGKIRSNCLFIDGMLRKLVNAVDVALISVSPPDERGFCTMGVDVDCSLAAATSAKKIIAIINPSMPATFGAGLIHSSHIDYFVETDRPIYAKGKEEVSSENERKIGEIIAENLVENGATLQLGIGAIPDSTLAAMKNHKNLGVHTELVSDGVLDLIELGVINNSKKSIMPGKIVTSFAYGTEKFYKVLDRNPIFHFESCAWTNHVDIIRQNSRMTCINSCLEIDLTGQIVSDSIGSKFYSGFGGQVDFIFGSSVAVDKRGKAIIALTSRTNKGKSKIVPTLAQGAGVVTTRGHVNYVVTEYGVANLWGKNVRERARELINIAHPDDRENLEKEAYERFKCIV
ncbi:unnamed protein product [Auanema sp. JU1783]|nr:unnamed protein product [Auanema sp. JU1783]